jgi:CheY-like chemotaxis protein
MVRSPLPRRVKQSLPSIHVLVVEDSAQVREVLTEVLEWQGARVTSAGTAEHALDLLERLRPDVLLSDLEMPEKDGYWLIDRVRSLAPDRGGLIPAVCLTGCSGPEDLPRILRAGFQCRIEKPVGMSRLLGVLGSFAPNP